MQPSSWSLRERVLPVPTMSLPMWCPDRAYTYRTMTDEIGAASADLIELTAGIVATYGRRDRRGRRGGRLRIARGQASPRHLVRRPVPDLHFHRRSVPARYSAAAAPAFCHQRDLHCHPGLMPARLCGGAFRCHRTGFRQRGAGSRAGRSRRDGCNGPEPPPFDRPYHRLPYCQSLNGERLHQPLLARFSSYRAVRLRRPGARPGHSKVAVEAQAIGKTAATTSELSALRQSHPRRQGTQNTEAHQ